MGAIPTNVVHGKKGDEGLGITSIVSILLALIILGIIVFFAYQKFKDSGDQIDNTKSCSGLTSILGNTQGAATPSKCVPSTDGCGNTPDSKSVWQRIPFGCNSSQVCCYLTPKDVGASNDAGAASKTATPPCTERVGGIVSSANARLGSCMSSCTQGYNQISSDSCAKGFVCCYSSSKESGSSYDQSGVAGCQKVFIANSAVIDSNSLCSNYKPDCYLPASQKTCIHLSSDSFGVCRIFDIKNSPTNPQNTCSSQ